MKVRIGVIQDNKKVVLYDFDKEIQEIDKEIRSSFKNIKVGEAWKIVDTVILKEDILLAVSPGELAIKSSKNNEVSYITLKIKDEVNGFKIANEVSIKYSSLYSGPEDIEALFNDSNNGYLTIFVPMVYCNGDIVNINYEVFEKGEYIRDEKVIVAVKKEVSYYNIGVQNGEYFKAENIEGNRYITFENYVDYKEKLRNNDLEKYLNF